MFTATYPATLLPEENGKGFHVRFPDLPEALTGGADLDDTSCRLPTAWPKPLPDGLRAGTQFRRRPS
jgi:predicted RNase H-like HicB family nuclease